MPTEIGPARPRTRGSRSSGHVLDGSSHHYEWDPTLDPILTVACGDVLHLELPMGSDPDLHEGSVAADLDVDALVYKLVGPIEGGGALEIEIVSLEPGDWGWTVVVPGLGLLAEDFADTYLKIWDLRACTHASLARERRGARLFHGHDRGALGAAADVRRFHRTAAAATSTTARRRPAHDTSDSRWASGATVSAGLLHG